MSERRLVSVRRWIVPARRGEYDAAWARWHAAAMAHGAHAWRFVCAAQEELFIEFLEFGGIDPRKDAETAAALRDLDVAFRDPPPSAKAVEEWRSVSDPAT